MNGLNNTIFLRLEGPLQAWGTQESKFVIRASDEAPTKSGIIGLLCASMGISRREAKEWFPRFHKLKIGVRIDRPGIRWWDYNTIGAKIGSLTAVGKPKYTATTKEIETLLSRREFLCDASFLVAIRGEPQLIQLIHEALLNPKWTLYLGRKSCPPSVPIHSGDIVSHDDLVSALKSIPWRPRSKNDKKPEKLTCLTDWTPTDDKPYAPDDAEIWYDMPDSFERPSHHPRFVIREELSIGEGKDVEIGELTQNRPPSPKRPRADYTNSEWKKVRKKRLDIDHHLCAFCKSPGTTVQHITYRHAGGEERIDELITLCRLCHDAVTMIEYGENMGIDRINPCEEKWKDRITQKRNEIIRYRSLATRKRKLSGEDE